MFVRKLPFYGVCLQKEQFLHKLRMNHFDQYDQSPPQVTLTNQWLDTKRDGRNDMPIKRDAEKVEATIKRKWKREKVFKRLTGSNGVVELTAAKSWLKSGLSEITTNCMQLEVLEAEVDNYSSSNNDFVAKLISPLQKYRNNESRFEILE